MKEQDRIWQLIARRLAGDATEKDLQELQQLLKANPDMTYSLQLMIDLWKTTPKEEGMPEGAFDRHLKRLAIAQKKSGGRSRYRPPKDGKRWSLFTSHSILHNYGKTIGRNLLRNKTFSIINITGLAIGMASALLILLWIRSELSFDLFHEKKDRIYQVFNRGTFDGKVECWPATPMVLAPALEKEYPQVEEAARINWVGAFVLSNGDKHLQTQGDLTDASFFRIFSFPLL